MEIKKDMVWDRDAVLHLLASSNLATGKALYGLFERQTADEKATNTTRDHNGRGFNGRDAEFLSDIAKRLPVYDFRLTARQLPHVRKALAKYTRQLLEIIEEKGGRVEYTKSAKREKAQSLNPEQATSPQVEIAPQAERPAMFALF